MVACLTDELARVRGNTVRSQKRESIHRLDLITVRPQKSSKQRASSIVVKSGLDAKTFKMLPDWLLFGD